MLMMEIICPRLLHRVAVKVEIVKHLFCFHFDLFSSHRWIGTSDVQHGFLVQILHMLSIRRQRTSNSTLQIRIKSVIKLVIKPSTLLVVELVHKIIIT